MQVEARRSAQSGVATMLSRVSVRVTGRMTAALRRARDGVSDLVVFLEEVVAATLITRPRGRDVLEATGQVLSVGWRPVVFVAFPVGMTFALNFYTLLGLVGLRDLGAAGLVPATVRETGPLFGGIVAAATVGAAFCADIGARRVRDEISSSEVMCVEPKSRLYLPRILGAMIGVPILALYATLAALLGGFVFFVVLRHVPRGLFMDSFGFIVRTQDMFVLIGKGVLFGFIVGTSSCFFGDRAKGGPTGVAAATRASIIASFAMIGIAGTLVNQLVYAP